MSLGPILPGRLPTSLVTARLSQDIHASALALARLQDQIASGKKYFLPGENPASSIRAIVLQKSLDSRNQIQTNIGTDRTFLLNSESNLAPVSDLLNRAKSALQAGLGSSSTNGERVALADEVATMLQGALGVANANYQGRYLFAGTQNSQPPFQLIGGAVRYLGDSGSINSFVDVNTLVANNVDGATAFGALSSQIGGDINPALTASTRVGDLLAGRGVKLGNIQLTLDDGVNPVQSATVDLTSAATIGDIKTRLENAFAGSPITLTVDVDPASSMGIRLTPSAGTVAVSDINGSNVARDLGILGGPASAIVGSDLEPALTIHTALAALNGGAGIGSTAGTGLLINNGITSKVVDLSSANTVQDVLNILRQSDLDLVVGINADRNGIAIASRLSGKRLTIGENGGTNAAGLGIRTMTPDTFLVDLNLGAGVINEGQSTLKITRRDGTNIEVDLENAVTVQDVIDAVNAVTDMQARFNLVGNGIEIADASGTGPLVIDTNAVSTALGIAGTESGSDPAVYLSGTDVNPQPTGGVFSILLELEQALRSGDNKTLSRLESELAGEIDRFTLVRAETGSKLKLLDTIEARLQDNTLQIQEALSNEIDTDITEAILKLAQQQANYETSLKVAAQTFSLNLLNFL